MNTKRALSRRRFLKTAAMATAAPWIVPASAFGSQDQPAPSERVAVGMIGVGRQAYLKNMKQFLGMPDVQIDGSKGWIRAGFRDILAEPASILDSRIGPDEIQFRFKSDKQDFIDCVKTRQETLEPAEVGHRVTSLCHLGHIAIHTGRKLQWDPKREHFVDDDGANEYLNKPIHAPRHA